MQQHQNSVQLFWWEKKKKEKREPSCQDPTWTASQLLDKSTYLRLHHKQLPFVQYFGHTELTSQRKAQAEILGRQPLAFPQLAEGRACRDS